MFCFKIWHLRAGYGYPASNLKRFLKQGATRILYTYIHIHIYIHIYIYIYTLWGQGQGWWHDERRAARIAVLVGGGRVEAGAGWSPEAGQ